MIDGILNQVFTRMGEPEFTKEMSSALKKTEAMADEYELTLDFLIQVTKLSILTEELTIDEAFKLFFLTGVSTGRLEEMEEK